MNGNLVTKEVNFFGDTIMCVQDNSTEKIYVGVSWICDGIGLTKKQKDRQVMNLQADFVLAESCIKLPLKFGGQVREALSIELEYLPLWLAKISITPRMLTETPEVANRLKNYQLKAKDVLANAFVKKQKMDLDSFHIPTTLSEALLLSANLAKENEVMKPKAEQFDLYLDDTGTLSFNQVAKALKTKCNKMMSFLRDKGILNQDNSPASYVANRGYFEVKNFTYKTKDGKQRQVAITRVTAKGQNFLYRYLAKYIDEYSCYDKEYQTKLSEVQIYEATNC